MTVSMRPPRGGGACRPLAGEGPPQNRSPELSGEVRNRIGAWRSPRERIDGVIEFIADSR